MIEENGKKKVVYLVGAGASHGSVKAVNSSRGILMTDLADPLVEAVNDLVRSKRKKYSSLKNLVNDIIDQETDFEHVITFLDESPSIVHRQFAADLRDVFAKVLKKQLAAIRRDLGDDRFKLYGALLDMYEVSNCPEQLGGILSLNYDEYIEAATRKVCKRPVDYGLAIWNSKTSDESLKLIKLHGSFNWTSTWPIRTASQNTTTPLWIPPGIQKSKQHYPFNVLWGTARELLDCDVLRIIGCRLGASDWDLISLLFSSRHSNVTRKNPFAVEVIDVPQHAFKLKASYPYLDIRSVLEVEEAEVGAYLVSELIGGPPRRFDELDSYDKDRLLSGPIAGINWFRLWLVQMTEAFERDLSIESLDTKTNEFQQLLDES